VTDILSAERLVEIEHAYVTGGPTEWGILLAQGAMTELLASHRTLAARLELLADAYQQQVGERVALENVCEKWVLNFAAIAAKLRESTERERRLREGLTGLRKYADVGAGMQPLIRVREKCDKLLGSADSPAAGTEGDGT
jgi:hypothetical protein